MKEREEGEDGGGRSEVTTLTRGAFMNGFLLLPCRRPFGDVGRLPYLELLYFHITETYLIRRTLQLKFRNKIKDRNALH